MELTQEQIEEYKKHLAPFAMTEAEKEDYLRMIWQVMSAFVDQAWGGPPAEEAIRDWAKTEFGPKGNARTSAFHPRSSRGRHGKRARARGKKGDRQE